MTRRLFIITFSVLLFAAGATVSSAQSWTNLGTKEVTDRAEQDTFHIRSTKGQFRKLRFLVGRNPIRFTKMEITYSNGDKDEKQIAFLVPAGRYSRILDVEGRDRFIRKVDFWYEAATLGPGRRSSITLFGLK